MCRDCNDSVCTVAECCDPNPKCSSNVCSTAFIPKSPMPVTACQTEACGTDECCVAKGSCTDYRCATPNTVKKNSSAPCSGVTCKDAECDCQLTCASVDCTGDLIPAFDIPAAEVCDKQCTAGKCCLTRAKCSDTASVSLCDASVGLVSRKQPSVCGKSCSAQLCCDQMPDCTSTLKCSARMIAKPIVGGTKQYCGQTPCTETECCDLRDVCTSFTCPGATHRAMKQPKPCGLKCNQDQCCDVIPTCGSFTCPSTYLKKDNVAATQCKGEVCDPATCCAKIPLCSTFTCDSTHFARESPPACPMATGCSMDHCCFLPGRCLTDFDKNGCSEHPGSIYTNTTICVLEMCTSSDCCHAQMQLELDESQASNGPAGWLIAIIVIATLVGVAGLAILGIFFYNNFLGKRSTVFLCRFCCGFCFSVVCWISVRKCVVHVTHWLLLSSY